MVSLYWALGTIYQGEGLVIKAMASINSSTLYKMGSILEGGCDINSSMFAVVSLWSNHKKALHNQILESAIRQSKKHWLVCLYRC